MKDLINFYVEKWGNEVKVIFDEKKQKVYMIDKSNYKDDGDKI